MDDVLSKDERTEETVRLVVEAFVEEMAVVEAYGAVNSPSMKAVDDAFSWPFTHRGMVVEAVRLSAL